MITGSNRFQIRFQIVQLGLVSLMLGGVLAEAAIAQHPTPPLGNFTTLCQNKENLSPDQRQAIDTWLNQAGTQNCDRATQVLSAPLQSNPANPFPVNEYRVINLPPMSVFRNPSGNPTTFRIQFGQPQ